MIDLLCAARVSGIALFSATGEYPGYSLEERTRLVYLSAKRSRVPIFAGVGSTSLDDSVTLAREAQHSGAAGLFVPPPHFFAYSQTDLREFYLQFAAQVRDRGQIWIANTPAVTSPIAPETAFELLATGRFAGLEDPGANASFFAAHPVAYLTSDDAAIVCARRTGARGVVSSAACAVPELVVALDRALANGDPSAVDRRQAQLQEFLAWTGEFPHPLLVKVAGGMRGLKPGPPAIPLSAARQQRLDQFRRWFEGWLPSVKQ
jgi:4-hydroxy-tetrahydrodipicolinate synthase